MIARRIMNTVTIACLTVVCIMACNISELFAQEEPPTINFQNIKKPEKAHKVIPKLETPLSELYSFPWTMFLPAITSKEVQPEIELNSIKIYPEHVGVFTTVGKQQFLTFGTKSDGSIINVTNQATCTSSNGSVVTINTNGLATVKSGVTSGQVAITCTYPGVAPDATSLTVVNVTEFPWGSVDVTQWGGAWPNSNDHITTGEVYLYNVHFTSDRMSWNTEPYLTPYPVASCTINSMVAAVWSLDRGKTFKLGSWDYLGNYSHGKGLEGGMPDCWMGTMVHSICDRKPGECNGRNRSNLYFTEYPSGAIGCWGSP